MVRAVSNRVEIDGLKLPPAPHTLIQLIEVCRRDEADFDELHHIVSRDAALVSRIISVAHSAAYGQWREVDDLRRLLVVLGVDRVRSLALVAAIQQFFSSFSAVRAHLMTRLWMDSLIAAQLSRRLAELIHCPQPDLAWLAGLLHRVGQLVLIENVPDDYPELMQQATDLPHQARLEQQHFGIDFCAVGARLVENWGETQLADALRFQLHPLASMGDAPTLVKLLNRTTQWTRLHAEPRLAVLEDGLFGLQQDLILDLLEHAIDAAMEDARQFSININPDSHYPTQALDNEDTRIQLAERIRDLSLMQASEQGLEQPESAQTLLRQLQENLRLLLGLPRSLAFLPSPDRQALRGIAPETEDLVIRLEAGRSQAADCVLETTGHETAKTGSTAHTVIDLQLRERLGRPDFTCLPLQAGDVLQAVLLIGYDKREEPVLEERRPVMKHLASRVARLLQLHQQMQQQREQALDQQRLELESRSRELAHEIRNPLTTIRNYLELLSSQIRDAEARPHIDTIKSEIDRVGRLLRQLSHPSVDTGEDSTAVDVNRLIEDLVALYRPELRALHDIHCELQLDPELPAQRLDRNRLKQVMANLLKNAAEALPPGGTVRIRTRSPVIVDGQNRFEITVADSGPGVDPTLLPRLFSPVPTTKGADHAGLGLSIVHRLVQEMGGSIGYGRSADLGGAEFTLLLPLMPTGTQNSEEEEG